MSNPFVAEIRMWACNFAPRGWAFCNGQILAISQNTALFSLIGTNYGGNGTSNFGLPNLQGSAAMHSGAGAGLTQRFIGESGGETNVTLLTSEIPSHNHAVQAKGNPPPANAGTPDPSAIFARSSGGTAYTAAANLAAMAPQTITQTGGNQPHNNMMPFLALNFCIALQGIFPPRP